MLPSKKQIKNMVQIILIKNLLDLNGLNKKANEEDDKISMIGFL